MGRSVAYCQDNRGRNFRLEINSIIKGNGYIPRERFLDPPPPPPINFVHGSDRKCLNLT